MVVAQLVEWSLPTPEVRGSNLAIGEILLNYSLHWKEDNKKRPGMAHFFKKKQSTMQLSPNDNIDKRYDISLTEHRHIDQYDQIGRFFELWATF